MSRRWHDHRLIRDQWSAGDAISASLGMLAGVIVLVIVGIVMAALFSVRPAKAHDGWINKGSFKNANNELCCGDYDCKPYKTALSTSTGWMLDGEFVPFDEAMPVAPPDGMVTVCRRPDGTRRCVFGVKPGL